VHTEADALARAIEHLRGAGVERIVCTGDLADGPGDTDDVARCCELLADNDVLTVCGNHDRWVHAHEMRDLDDATDPDDLEAEVLERLGVLPATAELPTPIGTLLLCHGMGPDDMAGVQPFDHGPALSSNAALQKVLRTRRHAIVVAGHTHRAMVRTIDGTIFVNAGTLHREFRPCFGFIDFDDSSVEFVELGPDWATGPTKRLPFTEVRQGS